ncbi:uncharacterized protein LY89DRAFT_269550 [Mollisia scopiformis]|uniref:Uncharacterized protein n=1 Tax=Mollisia scopiformis TaxID=149040 RepID=A0A132BCD4_MOLSC|nr:uncharacterized protein LY89DRAFT_269550 [Mollisia scopiformis]KUJ10090.1 hypothetical protein LY89DRAFT_269550 [Mollisia scopiformis]
MPLYMRSTPYGARGRRSTSPSSISQRRASQASTNAATISRIRAKVNSIRSDPEGVRYYESALRYMETQQGHIGAQLRYLEEEVDEWIAVLSRIEAGARRDERARDGEGVEEERLPDYEVDESSPAYERGGPPAYESLMAVGNERVEGQGGSWIAKLFKKGRDLFRRKQEVRNGGLDQQGWENWYWADWSREEMLLSALEEDFLL